ncbi:hypothetical protein PG988_013626 [Apiospora saccharicola]
MSEMASLLESTSLRLAAGVVPAAAPCSEMASTNLAAVSRAAIAAADAAEDEVEAPWSTPDRVLP